MAEPSEDIKSAAAAQGVTRGAVLRALLQTMAWPAAAAVSLAVAVGKDAVTGYGLLLLACGTMSAYGLDRLIDRRDRDADALRRFLFLGVLLVALVTGVLACTDLWRFKVCVLLSLIAGAYVPLKRYLPKNVLTTTAWTTAIATLPFSGPQPLQAEFGASVLAVAFIMAANTLLSDLPDVEADRRAGVKGIAPAFGPRAGAVAALCGGGLGVLAGVFAANGGLAATALSLAVVALRVVRHPTRNHRLLADALVTIIPGTVTLLLYWVGAGID